MLEPAVPGRAWGAVAAAILAIVGLLGAARLHGPARWAAVAATSVVALLLAFLAGGVSADMLRPANWGALASGIQRGISDLPARACPTAASTSGSGW